MQLGRARFRTRLRAGFAFNPTWLFSSGAQGAWYDPSYFPSLYQTSTGTTPVTAVEQPVGLMLDRSKGLVLGPELVTNGGFDSATGWTVPAGWAITGGQAVATATGGSLFGGSMTTVLGRWYQVEFDVVSYTSGNLLITIGANYSGNPTLTGAAMAPGRKSVLVLGGSSTTRGVEFYGGSITATIDNISVRELPGNHASQATSASRPILRATNRLDFDGSDDRIVAAAGGGGTTGMLFVAGVNLDVVGSASTIWSDTGTNTGYRVRINASNEVELSAGNGSAYTTVTTSETLASGTNYVIAAWHDGTNLNARLGLSGAIAQTAFATATAGTAAFTLGMDNGATSSFLNGKLYNAVYVRNFSGTLSNVNATASYVSGKMV